MSLHHALDLVGLFMKCGSRRRRLFTGKEPICISGLQATLSNPAITTHAQTLPRWHYRNVSGDHARITQITFAYVESRDLRSSAAKLSRRHAGNSRAYARIGQRQVYVGNKRLASTNSQRSKPAAVSHINVGDVDYSHAIESASIPRIEVVMRSHRQPANGAKAETHSHGNSVPESNERYVRRRPYRTVMRIDRSRPPYP